MSNIEKGFPKGFLWGAATSAYQVEGGYNEGNKGLSLVDIESFEKSGVMADTKVSSDFYHNYVQDIELMSELGLKSYRFSIAWTRIFPNGDDKEVNQAGIDYYKDIIIRLKEKNIEPIITIFHFDLPIGLVNKYNGWASRKIIDDFTRYAKTLFEHFGENVKYWLIINEQNLMSRKDSHMGIKRLEGQEKEKMRHQMNYHMFLASASVVKLCHEICADAKIGPAFSYFPTYAASNKPEDVLAAREAENYFDHYLIDTYVFGSYPKYYVNYLEEHGWMPKTEKEDDEILKGSQPDFLGFNYYLTFCAEYCKENVKDTEYNAINKLVVPGHFRNVDNENLVATEYGWPIDPIGFRKALHTLYDCYRLPLMITENGFGGIDVLEEDGVHDQYRIDYLKKHIKEMKKAIIDGVPVISYNVWTLMDVLSTREGFNKRYGLIYINRGETDIKDLRRIKKDSFYWYKNVIKSNGSWDTLK